MRIPKKYKSAQTLEDFLPYQQIEDDGLLIASKAGSFILEVRGLDASFMDENAVNNLEETWRSLLLLEPEEELQLNYRKRVEFSKWVERQLARCLAVNNGYAKRLALDQLGAKLSELSEPLPRALSERIFLTYTRHYSSGVDVEDLRRRRDSWTHFLERLSMSPTVLNREMCLREMANSAQSSQYAFESEAAPEWPQLRICPHCFETEDDVFRAVQLTKLPEEFSELGMIQALSLLPYPIDIAVRFQGRDEVPLIRDLERRSNLLHAQVSRQVQPSPQKENQLDEIQAILRSFTNRTEGFLKMSLTVGVRLPKSHSSLLRHALSDILRAQRGMNYCEFEEATLGVMDAFMECIPGFRGKNLSFHSLLSSNGAHFLPFFADYRGEEDGLLQYRTRSDSFFGINPFDPQLPNYNWLISGTSGAGKSFFVNSVLFQSMKVDPQIFIVDIGGSYDKVVRYLDGHSYRLDPRAGFQLSPFFLPKIDDTNEERLRREHIFLTISEMLRGTDGKALTVEEQQILKEALDPLLDADILPERPLSVLRDRLVRSPDAISRRLSLQLNRWCKPEFFGEFVDTSKSLEDASSIMAFDLKGLSDFEELSRVFQFIICSSLWARIRRSEGRFSWIVLDEVAFSLLKSQPQFVDELVATVRKHNAGVITVVQDLEKITSNSVAGASVLQNTAIKAILQQRGDLRNVKEPLGLNGIEVSAIRSLSRRAGEYSEIFLRVDQRASVIRYRPSKLEYWLSTSSANDNRALSKWLESDGSQKFQQRIDQFVGQVSA